MSESKEMKPDGSSWYTPEELKFGEVLKDLKKRVLSGEIGLQDPPPEGPDDEDGLDDEDGEDPNE